MQRSLAEVIGRFVPRRVARHPLLAAPLEAPHTERADGAVLFADISGFTALSEDLARSGASASEELTAILNDYFGRLTSIIDAHGGDVVKFAGDALLALWPGADAAQLAATARAADCAREIQRVLRTYGVADGKPLRLRMGIGAGPVLASFVGGVYGRWEFVVAGPPLRQSGVAAAHAEPGSIVLSPEAARLLGARVIGRSLADGHLELLDLAPLERALLDPVHVDARRAEHLKAFVPRAIWQRIAAGQTEWLGELRRLSVVLVNLKGLDEEIGLTRAQAIMCALQTALYRYEGSLNKLSVDDKGVTLVAAFGLPPLFHEDDALRAVKSALEIERVLEQMGVRCSIGVTTGRVYCGAVGGDARREYTVIGRPVNVAARLMMANLSGILIDAATHAAAQRSIACDERGRIELKGLPALEVWQPRRLAVEDPASAQSRLVGRASERARLRASLAELVANGRSSVILIEGEAGIGKSCLVGDLIVAAREAEVALFVGAADAIEKSTAYHVWRGIAAQVLEYDVRASAEERTAQVQRSLGSDPELGELLPLLNGILPLEFPETKRSAQMSAETRAQNVRELLLRLIQRAAKGRPIVVVIDDLHWMDSASWGVAVQLAREVAPLLLVLASRPMASAPAELAALLARGERLELDALSQRDTLQLVASRLGVSELPPEMARLIAERAEGHPLFSEEIGYALRDAGLIEIANGQCRLRGGDLSSIDLPSTVEGVITTRIDRLAPEEQLTLKVASVIGRVFRARELWSIHPMSRAWDAILADLRTLDAADLTPLEEADPHLSYIFKHVITRDVAYSLMLFAQRQELHRAAAEWYEREHGDDLAIYYPLLAHHWAGAADDAKTVHYLECAAERALHSYANHEVVRFLREAVERSGGEASLDAARRTRWESMLGEAKRGLGHYPEAGKHMEGALAELGFPIPSSTPRLLLGIVREGARQLWQRLVPPRAPADEERGAELLEAAHLSERIWLIYFFAAEDLKMMYSGLAAVNLAQRVGHPSVVLARGYCTLQVMMASLGLLGQSRYFGARAEQTAKVVDHFSSTMWMLLARSVSLSGLGRWSEAEPPLDEAAELAERLGDGRSWCEITASKGTTTGARGAYLESIAIYESVLKNAERRGDFQSQGWGVLGQARGYAALRRLDRLDEILARAAELTSAGGADIDLLTQYDHRALRALRELHRGDDERARVELTGMAHALRTQRAPNQWMLIHPFGAFAEGAVELWSRHPERRDDRALARNATRRLQRFARIFPCAKPRASWLQGRLEDIRGRRAQAIEHWRSGLAVSRALEMRYDEWLCCEALACAAQADVPDRDVLARRAQELKRQIEGA